MALGAMVALGAPACGGAEVQPAETAAAERQRTPAPPKPIHERGTDEVRAEVPTAGGTLELANGARVEVPADALPARTTLTFSVGPPTQVFAHREHQQPVGPMLQLEPALVATPGKRLRISVPFVQVPSGFTQDDLALAVESVAEQRALGMGGTQTRWQNFPVTVEGNRLVGELAEVPGMRLVFLAAR
jgi:hypothetical protein